MVIYLHKLPQSTGIGKTVNVLTKKRDSGICSNEIILTEAKKVVLAWKKCVEGKRPVTPKTPASAKKSSGTKSSVSHSQIIKDLSDEVSILSLYPSSSARS